jgi:hypothetical protein
MSQACQNAVPLPPRHCTPPREDIDSPQLPLHYARFYHGFVRDTPHRRTCSF